MMNYSGFKIDGLPYLRKLQVKQQVSNKYYSHPSKIALRTEHKMVSLIFSQFWPKYQYFELYRNVWPSQ